MPPLLDNKDPSSPSVFRPAALLREARRQKGLTDVEVPAICILDPDGDMVRRLRKEGRSKPFEGWPCYHSQLDAFELAGQTVGIIGCAVGAPFAVLIAEELFASGCRFLLSLTSAGQITPSGPTPYFVIINRALRDEGTSYHYASPSDYADADAGLVASAIPGNGGGDRRRAIQRCVGGRDGSCGSLCLCPRERRGGSLSGACDQQYGASRTGFRKRRSRRNCRRVSRSRSDRIRARLRQARLTSFGLSSIAARRPSGLPFGHLGDQQQTYSVASR